VPELLNETHWLREIKKEYPFLKKRFLVCMEPQARFVNESRSTKKDPNNGIEIIPYSLFTKKLWSHKLFF